MAREPTHGKQATHPQQWGALPITNNGGSRRTASDLQRHPYTINSTAIHMPKPPQGAS